MPATPSADGLRRAFRVRSILESTVFSPRQKLLLLALNAWPLAHATATIGCATLLPVSFAYRIVIALIVLLLLPPLLCRIVNHGGLTAGRHDVPSRVFFRWWTTWQLQMVFNRLPWIDETLRLVPGLYSAWLRLWGARVGRLTLWSPGVRVYDRPLLRVGADVVCGIDVRLIGHLAATDAEGRMTLLIGPISLGDRTSVGASAILGAGFTLDSDQATEALFLGMPFTRWRAGDRVPAAEDFPVTPFV